MWKPNEKIKDEIINFLKNSQKENSNKKDVFKTFEEFSKEKNFSKYLLLIFNLSEENNEIRLLSGKLLKFIIEANENFNLKDNLTYFKNNILNNFFDENISIQKLIANLIKIFIIKFSIENFPEILNFITENFEKEIKENNNNNNNKICYQKFFIILNTIIENSADLIISKYPKFLNKIIKQLIFLLQTANDNLLLENLLNTLLLLFYNYKEILFDSQRDIINLLKKFSNTKKEINIKILISKIWFQLLHLNKLLLEYYFDEIFIFFLKNFKSDNYELCLISSQFFIFLINENENFLKIEKIKVILKNYLQILLPLLLKNMSLTEKDLIYLDNKFQNELVIYSNSNSSNLINSICNSSDSNSNNYSNHNLSNSHENLSNNNSNSNTNSGNNSDNNSGGSNTTSNNNSDNSNSGSNSSENSSNSSSASSVGSSEYNPNMTLRKCCSRILDSISIIFPKETFYIMRPFFENEIQSTDDLIKERSILGFGAISNGCYFEVYNHLKIVIPFLITELQHPDKFVRAISLWTLNRYKKFIFEDFNNDELSIHSGSGSSKDNNNNNNSNNYKNYLFKEYLIEILKKLIDTESIVRESAANVILEIIYYYKNSLEPFIYDIIKIIINVFDKYTGSNLLIIYELLNDIMENYEAFFKNKEYCIDLVNILIQKWYDLVKYNDNLTLPQFFDVIINLIKVSGKYLLEYCDYFLTGSLKIIEININYIKNKINLIDKNLLIKSLDLISNLCQKFESYIYNSPIKKNIIYFLFELTFVNDNYIINYVIMLFGDILKVDNKIIQNDKIENVLDYIINLIKNNKDNKNDLSLINNSIWTLSLIFLYYPSQSQKYINIIFEDVLINYFNTEQNTQLSQNIAILIGRAAICNAENVSKYLNKFFNFICKIIILINESKEKKDCILSLIKVVYYNIEIALNENFFNLIILNENDEKIKKEFQIIINNLYENYNEKFKIFYLDKLSEENRKKIKDKFNISF